jgi:hypothetical protein
MVGRGWSGFGRVDRGSLVLDHGLSLQGTFQLTMKFQPKKFTIALAGTIVMASKYQF